jgi:hypothetical protein
MSHVTSAQVYAIKAKLQMLKVLERATQLNMEALVSTMQCCSNRPIVLTFCLGICIRNLPGGKGRPARGANLTAICEPIV